MSYSELRNVVLFHCLLFFDNFELFLWIVSLVLLHLAVFITQLRRRTTNLKRKILSKPHDLSRSIFSDTAPHTCSDRWARRRSLTTGYPSVKINLERSSKQWWPLKEWNIDLVWCLFLLFSLFVFLTEQKVRSNVRSGRGTAHFYFHVN